MSLLDGCVETEYMELPEAAWTPQLKRAVDCAAIAAEEALGLPPDWLDVRVRIPHHPLEAKLYAHFRRDGEAPRPHVAVKASGHWSSSAPREVWCTYTAGPAETVLDVLHEAYHAAKARAGGALPDEVEEEAEAEAFALRYCGAVYTACNEEGGLS
jgi:hypothetical protein